MTEVPEKVYKTPPAQRRAYNAWRERKKRAQQEAEELSPYEKLIEDIHKKATEGDMRAAELWLDIQSKQAPADAFNVDVTIVPYTIADKSLANIIAQADTQIVVEMLAGLQLRLKVDEAPHNLVEVCRCLSMQFEEWAKVAYKPKDAQ
jgi:hypothetical protein